MPRDTFARAAARLLRGRIGSTATLTNYTPETDANGDVVYDEHGDPTRTVDGETTGVPALFRQPQATNDVDQDSMGGVNQAFDVLVFVPDSYDVREPGDDHTYATRITDETNGKDYDVVSVWAEHNGTARLACKEV